LSGLISVAGTLLLAVLKRHAEKWLWDIYWVLLIWE